jgi:hypothetical protein
VEKRLFLSEGHFEGKITKNRKKDEIMILTLNMGLPFKVCGIRLATIQEKWIHLAMCPTTLK